MHYTICMCTTKTNAQLFHACLLSWYSCLHPSCYDNHRTKLTCKRNCKCDNRWQVLTQVTSEHFQYLLVFFYPHRNLFFYILPSILVQLESTNMLTLASELMTDYTQKFPQTLEDISKCKWPAFNVKTVLKDTFHGLVSAKSTSR